MSQDAVITFLAIGSLLAGTAGVALLVVAAVPSWRGPASVLLGGQERVLATACAVGMTLGSLYFSEVAHFIPCKLCWFQRIAAYPLVPILVMSVLRRDRGVWPYVISLSVPGSLISLYHIGVENFPSLDSGSCDPAAPCSLKWVNQFGFLTIPTMALCCFVFITALGIHGRLDSDPSPPEVHP